MKYRKLVENAKKPNGFWGKMMIKAMNKGHSSLTSWGLEHMNIERTATVLDIGCGGGKTVDRLCSIVANGKVYHGVTRLSNAGNQLSFEWYDEGLVKTLYRNQLPEGAELRFSLTAPVNRLKLI